MLYLRHLRFAPLPPALSNCLHLNAALQTQLGNSEKAMDSIPWHARGELPKRELKTSFLHPFPFLPFPFFLCWNKKLFGWEESCISITIYLWQTRAPLVSQAGWGCWLHESAPDALHDALQGWSFPLSFVPGKAKAMKDMAEKWSSYTYTGIYR